MLKTTTNEKSIYYNEYGNGEPLLLIAGLASDSQSWSPIINSLAAHFRIIVFDNSGVGRSSNDNTDITIKKMAEDCVILIKKLGLSSINVLGHSMGGMIAMDLAIRHPEMVNKLILEATSPKINERNIELFSDWVLYLKSGIKKDLWFRNIFYWIFSPTFFNDKAMFNQAVKMAIDYPYPQTNNSFENQVKAISTFNCVAQIKTIKASTLIVFGENDLLFPHSETIELFKNISKAKTITIPKTAHSIHMENPEEFSKIVIDFMSVV